MILFSVLKVRQCRTWISNSASETGQRSSCPSSRPIPYSRSDPKAYSHNPNYLGCVVGRVANRIRDAAFTLPGADPAALDRNAGAHCLHGGHRDGDRVSSWGHLPWALMESSPSRATFQLFSPAGHGGFPGSASATATYAFLSPPAAPHTPAELLQATCPDLTLLPRPPHLPTAPALPLARPTVLRLSLRCTPDAPCPINLVHHAYWNLAGAGSVRSCWDHVVQVVAAEVTALDADLVPDGRVRPVAGTPWDLTAPTPLEAHRAALEPSRGFDVNYVIAREPGSPGSVRHVASVSAWAGAGQDRSLRGGMAGRSGRSRHGSALNAPPSLELAGLGVDIGSSAARLLEPARTAALLGRFPRRRCRKGRRALRPWSRVLS